MNSNPTSVNTHNTLGKAICYLVLFMNLFTFIVLSFTKLPHHSPIVFFENHHLNIFLFMISSACLLSQYKNLKFFRMINWYGGFIILLCSLLLLVESMIYSNYITGYFKINEPTSLFTILSFFIIGLSLLDLSLLKVSHRMTLAAILLLLFATLGIILNVKQISLAYSMSLYSALNFILLAMGFLLLKRLPKDT